MTIDTKFVELIGVFLNYLRTFLVKRETDAREKYLIITKEGIIHKSSINLACLTVNKISQRKTIVVTFIKFV